VRALRVPTAGARVVSSQLDPRRLFALGADIYRSEDGGASWTNVTAFGEYSVIGSGQHDVVVSPLDAELVIVANDFGVWRSVDAGLSWSGLNQGLPNLRVRRILATPTGLAGTRAIVDGRGLVEAQPGEKDWRPIADS